MLDDQPCPCGGATFGACCGPILRGERSAATAEALMRSRFTAFAVGDVAHLLRTWHPTTRPPVLELDDDTTWRRLAVVGTERGGPWDDEGVVEFVAQHVTAGVRGRLHERSRFVREGDWFYLDGTHPG
ncbi:YchJ family protein [Cellulomonas edaphi]|uniref:YchJ family metal-binding protein n=1 Tax=Cellulomonas edaphi TaxID=3053468 RepID=A0ABT7SB89_9CELL|nr:YchJ family metal-binding protein [Cellulomons edaphi]MDM7832282.1 YchJ family metal-binding protein [Cellulomons edaphi]